MKLFTECSIHRTGTGEMVQSDNATLSGLW